MAEVSETNFNRAEARIHEHWRAAQSQPAFRTNQHTVISTIELATHACGH